MKRCPQCSREYDLTMSFCLDDGTELLYGPAKSEPGAVATGSPADEPATAILSEPGAMATGFPSGDAPTRAQIHTTEQTAVLPTGATDNSPKPRGLDKRLLLAPVALAVIVLGGFFGYRFFMATEHFRSIAVMPFVNESGNADVEYLSDGMTETLINSLSKLPNLSVKGRSSVFRYKGKDIDTKTLAAELGVQAVLYGRVVQRGDQLSLSLELLEAATENVIWSEKYDRKQADVVSLQSEIARDVSIELKSRLSREDTANVEKGYTANAEAYRLYLQGRFFWNKRTDQDVKKSMEYFEKAIAADPEYALAYAGLADAYVVLAGISPVPPKETFPKAREAAEKALKMDPTLAAPRATLASVLHNYDWKHAEAEVEYKRAIELDPNYPSAHQWYGQFLSQMGRLNEGIAEIERAHELDPFSPIISSNLGSAFRDAGRYDDAVAQFKKTLEIEPEFSVAGIHLYQTYLAAERYEDAIDLVEARGVLSEEEASQLKLVFRSSGARGFWQKLLEWTEKAVRAENQDREPLNFAQLELGAGNKEKALDYLETAVPDGRGQFGVITLGSDRRWEALREEPRFKALLRKVGLTD